MTHSCPDSATLAVFAEGKLDAAEREWVAAHVAECPECPQIVGSVVRFLADAVDDDESSRPSARWWWVIAAAVALCVPAVVWWTGTARDPLSRVRHRAAAASVRPVEGMLHGFEQRPFDDRRAAHAPGLPDVRLRVAADQLSRQEPTPAVLHARGVTALLLGESSEAVRLLRLAVQRADGDEVIWNDLAAAEIALGARGDSKAFPRALEACERALTLDNNLADAHFNRGIALQRLGREEEALLAFRSALAAHPSDRWRDEIHGRLTALQQRN